MTLRRLARFCAILYTAFISLFAADVFSESLPLPELAVALFMHLLPSILLVVVIAISWNRARVGALTFLSLGALFTLFFHTYKVLPSFLTVSAPLFVIGILFYLDASLRTSSRD